jgi:hypothetical protein
MISFALFFRKLLSGRTTAYGGPAMMGEVKQVAENFSKAELARVISHETATQTGVGAGLFALKVNPIFIVIVAALLSGVLYGKQPHPAVVNPGDKAHAPNSLLFNNR